MRKDSHAEGRPAVLVVDDEEIVLQLTRRTLEDDYDVFLASSVQAAEDILLWQEDIQVILCDHIMEGESGLDFCTRLQKRSNPAVRVLVTGAADLHLLSRAMNEHAIFLFLAKPYEVTRLRQVVRDAVTEYARIQQARTDRLVRETAERVPHTDRERFFQQCQNIVRLGGVALATLLLLLAVVFVVGIVVLLVLYFMKSALGIDVFADRHFSDFF